MQNVKDCAAPNVKTSYKPSTIFSVKSILQCSPSPRRNKLYLADIGDATYSSSDTEESVAFRLYRLEEGVRSHIVLTTHMVSSYVEKGEKDRIRQKEKKRFKEEWYSW